MDERLKKFAQLLYGVLFFNIFSIEELYAIVSEERMIKWKRFAKGHQIFRAGTYDQHFYIIIQGTVAITRPDGDANEKAVGQLSKGEVLGEMVVCSPGSQRRASAYCIEEVILCEIDATLVETVPENMRVKFLKKFLDLILDRFTQEDTVFPYYKKIIAFAEEKNGSMDSEYFMYSLESAANTQNHITQYIKYTDFLITRKIPPADACAFLKTMLPASIEELNLSFGTS